MGEEICPQKREDLIVPAIVCQPANWRCPPPTTPPRTHTHTQNSGISATTPPAPLSRPPPRSDSCGFMVLSEGLAPDLAEKESDIERGGDERSGPIWTPSWGGVVSQGG